MNVRNRIATFEVRNEEVRHQSLASPTTQSSLSPPHRDRGAILACSPTSSAAAVGGSMKNMHQHLGGPNSNNINNSSNSPSLLLDEGNKPPSTTSLASQSRIQRLRNSHGMAASINNNTASVTPTSSVVRKNEMVSAARLLGVPTSTASATVDSCSGARVVVSSSSSRSSSSRSTGGVGGTGTATGARPLDNNNNTATPPSASLFSHPKRSSGSNAGGRSSSQQRPRQQLQHQHHPGLSRSLSNEEDPGKIMSSATLANNNNHINNNSRFMPQHQQQQHLQQHQQPAARRERRPSTGSQDLQPRQPQSSSSRQQQLLQPRNSNNNNNNGGGGASGGGPGPPDAAVEKKFKAPAGTQRMQKIQRMQKNRSIERVRRRQQLGRSHNYHHNNSDAASTGTATTASSVGTGTGPKRSSAAVVAGGPMSQQQQQHDHHAQQQHPNAAAAQQRSARGYPQQQQQQQPPYPTAQQENHAYSDSNAHGRHAQQMQQQQQQQQQAHSNHDQFFENTHETFSQRGPPTPQQQYHQNHHDYDEEMTLTSVRQIVGTAAQQQQQQQGGQSESISLSLQQQQSNHHYNLQQQQQQQMLHHASSSMDQSNHNIRKKQAYNSTANGGGMGNAPPGDTTTRRWMGEEKKTDKAGRYGGGGGGGVILSRSSSSDYETAGYETDGERQVRQVPTSTSQTTTDVASFFEQSQRRKAHERLRQNGGGVDVGEPSFDYAFGDRDDDGSQVSLSYEQRRQKEILERQTREQAVAAAKAEMEGPFVRKDDVEYNYQSTIDSPIAQTACGVAVAATIGCLIIGPMGLLVGAAAVGIGVGVMQIPEEQRNNMNAKAGKALKGVSETAMLASESLSNSCASTYKDSGFADHVPVDVQSCCTGMEETMAGGKKHNNGNSMEKDQIQNAGSEDRAQLGGAGGDFMGGGGGAKEQRSPDDLHPRQAKKEKRGGVACLRAGTIIPVNQIYSLAPTDQPRAWLDVLASAETSYDEKMEAMEEILILAKDKTRARILVEEGILDSIMWTLSRYFEKLNYSSPEWAHPEITAEEAKAARLSAACCLRLGKAYCAAIHTEGDLMLMSLYERGTVPEERQLAQMLHEVPYHARVTKTNDPTLVDPSKEVFALQQMSLPQAEEFARSIKSLADKPLNNP